MEAKKEVVITIDYAGIKIDHLVEYSDDVWYLVIGRQSETICIFRVENNDSAYFFHSQKGFWREILDIERQMLISRVLMDRCSVPIFHVSGRLMKQEGYDKS